jgi:putative PIN family toxin of toxin-antitoxin system
MRVVIDTNVVVSRFLSPSGAPAKVFDLWRTGAFDLVVSVAILNEYREALAYQRVRSRHRMTDEEIAEVVSGFREFGILVEPEEIVNVIAADTEDNKLLECAVAGAAEYIVSGDRHLLDVGQYQGTQILSPEVFLAVLRPEI